MHIATQLSVQIAQWPFAYDLFNQTAIPGFSATFKALPLAEAMQVPSLVARASCRAFNLPTFTQTVCRAGIGWD